MSESFTVTARIDRPVDEVWAVLTDWDRAERWMDGIDDMRADGDHITYRARGRARTSTIVEHDPGRRVVLRSVVGGVTADYAYEVTDDGDGTMATLTARCTTTGGWAVLGPLIRRGMRRADRGQLDDLKALIEAD